MAYVHLPRQGDWLKTGTGRLSLVRDAKAHAVVMTADEPSETARYAVEELVWHVTESTGVALKVLPESEAPGQPCTRVYVGETEAARRLGIVPENLPREAYTMRCLGKDLFIVGRDGNEDPLRQDNPNAGTLFGVYEFLERFLGVRWLWPGKLGTYIPKTGSVEFRPVDETHEPALKFRLLHWSRIHAILQGGKLSEEDARLGFS